jgi:predicted acetyltransferase
MTDRPAPVYRAIDPGEFNAVASLMMMSFGEPQDAPGYAERNNHPEQFRVLSEGDDLVAGAWVGRLGQWWRGRRLPSAQVLNVGVPPQHRGRGHATALMRGLLGELHDDGVPTVTLFASTAALYRGVGFEVAGQWCWYEVLAEHLPRTTGGYQARQVPLDDLTEIRALYDRLATTRHGALDRDEDWWRERFASGRPGAPEPVAFVLDGPVPEAAAALGLAPDGGAATGPVGWVIVRFERYDEWKTLMTVRDWGCLPGAERALYGLFGSFNVLEGKVQWSGPFPDQAVLSLRERRYRLELADDWFLRVVDLPGALTQRPWPEGAKGRLTLHVDDAACPWNTGEWTLELADGKAQVERALPGTATLAASPRALATLFTGYLDPFELVRAGLLTGADQATIGFLREAFASPPPWTREHY